MPSTRATSTTVISGSSCRGKQTAHNNGVDAAAAGDGDDGYDTVTSTAADAFVW